MSLYPARNHGERRLYNGHCRTLGLTAEGCAARVRQHHPVYDFEDGLQGRIAVPAALAEDFIVRRRDGLYAYNLAVVVDDMDCGITEIVRGADLLEPTVRQIALYQTLGAPCPPGCICRWRCRPGNKLSSRITHRRWHRTRCARLWQALHFLGQCPPRADGEPGGRIIDWGIAHWQLARVPASEDCADSWRKRIGSSGDLGVNQRGLR